MKTIWTSRIYRFCRVQRHHSPFFLVLLSIFVLSPTTTAGDPPTQKEYPSQQNVPPVNNKAKAEKIFGLAAVHHFHFEFTPKQWETMQAVKGGAMFGGPPRFGGLAGNPKQQKQPSAIPDVHKAASFGLVFPWSQCELTAFGQTCKNVGIRYRGNYAYIMSMNGLKRSMKISIARHDKKQRFQGMKKINFSSGVSDPTRARETLTFAVFRAAGVPAPRTAYAAATLTVPGKYNKEFVGLSTVIEQVDSRFLKENFDKGKGLLCKPEGLRGIDYLGAAWAPYEKRYRVKGKAREEDKKRLIEFAELVNRADDKRFQKEIASYVDVDNFLRYLAVNALLANLDSFVGYGHNYYLYLRKDTNKFVFIPWDTDLSFGMWPPGGMPQQQVNLSIYHPHLGKNKLIDRLLAMKDVKKKYTGIVKELTTTCFTKEKILKDIAAIEKATKTLLNTEALAAMLRKENAGGVGGPGGMFGRSPVLSEFVVNRIRSVTAQLAGKSRGHVPPALNFGGPGGFGR